MADGQKLVGQVTVEFSLAGQEYSIVLGDKGMTNTQFPVSGLWTCRFWDSVESLTFTKSLRGTQAIEIVLLPDTTDPACTDHDRLHSGWLPAAL